MQCPNCETENRSGARFCAACGHPLMQAEPLEGQRPEPLAKLGTRLAEGATASTQDEKGASEEVATESVLGHAARRSRPDASAETGVDPQGDSAHAQAVGDRAVAAERSQAPAAEPGSDEDEIVVLASESTAAAPPAAGLAQPGTRSKPDTELADVAAREEQGDDARQQTARRSRPDPSTLEPLAVGELLLGRYEILELKASDNKDNVYVALDHGRCPVCRFDKNAPGDEYCAECGASLTEPPMCEIWEQPATVEVEPLARFDADGRRYIVVAVPPDDAQTQSDEISGARGRAPMSTTIDLRWAARTHPGQVRELNEDTVDVHVYSAEGVGSYPSTTLGLFIVADGVGGQAAGEVASRLATDTIWSSLRETIWLPELQGESVLPETIVARLEEAVHGANQVVYQQRTELGTDMGTTITLALVRGTTAVVANVGDSRTYRWNADGLQQLTQDHSLVQSLIDAGEVEPESVYSHPQRNVIYRSIGDRPRVEVDTAVYDVAPGDRLVLCSDGLWEMTRGEGIEETLLREPDPKAAADALVHLANVAGGTDNISAIVVEIAH